jgi:hypothetical protein
MSLHCQSNREPKRSSTEPHPTKPHQKIISTPLFTTAATTTSTTTNYKMTQPLTISLSEEQIDDLLYFARAGETEDFVQTLSELKAATNASEADILLATRDEFSQNNVLHMTAGNGYLGLFASSLTSNGRKRLTATELTKKILSFLPAPPTPDAAPHALLSQTNQAGNTPLHWAALNGHLEVVKILVMAANADPTLTNAAGHDAVFEAELNDKMEVVEWLLGHCEGLEEGVVGDKGEAEEEGVEEVESLEEVVKGVDGLDVGKGKGVAN